MELILIFVILLLIATTAIYWGLTLSLHLPELSRHFDRKPFNCTPCFTFHLAWILSVICSYLLHCFTILVGGFGLSLVLFCMLKYFDSKKISK
ncbi:hypothetical protein [Dysgonomonas sp. 511]|uniref:hypothetical protein n=1 Tax=Dysgonomonas sp. 511 TaxID=2302930 RepID=UPI0013D838E7|nr:hypothetical protein [Dysgonomonas sp. 511]NDV79346.1 hypothetical protein [Dysgonomonas sp. 511]